MGEAKKKRGRPSKKDIDKIIDDILEQDSDIKIAKGVIIDTGLPADDYGLKLVRLVNINDLKEEVENVKRGVGKPIKFTPMQLWEKFISYCEWMNDIASQSERAFGTGVIVRTRTQRPYTLEAFYLYAGITHKTFNYYEDKQEYIPITERIRHIILTQKKDGAIRGDFKENIIAREIGLKESVDVANTFDPTADIVIKFGQGNINAPKSDK